MHPLGKVALVLLLTANVEAFSARLSRPWETPSSSRPTSHVILIRASELEGSHAAADDEIAEVHDEEKDSIPIQSQDVLSFSKHTSIPSNSTTSSASIPPPRIEKAEPSIRDCLPDLITMTRPANLPGVVLFHMLGTYLVLPETAHGFWSLFFSPRMMMTLVALLLTSSTSMLVNDYYDYKLGHDTSKIHKPLPSHSITLATVRKFLTSLYALALMCVTVLPGAPARASVTMGLILTFWYTKHLKPKTWLKNAVCASLIALSPLTSGLAALGVDGTYSWNGIAPLIRVVSTLFIGIFGREITMDINDVEDDTKHGILTVPAVYGRRLASAISVGCSVGVACITMSAPVWEVANGRATISILRRLGLASLGGIAQLRRSWQVYKFEGMDKEVNDRAVDEGLLTVALILASFV
eukprot:scaffold4009_cov124-Cylindrotheca_fusiformis.AAC.20